MIILIMMTVELAGFLGLAGIKMNPISAVTVITAVGIGKFITNYYNYLICINMIQSILR